MKKIAIIGASEFQNPLILKAKEMGFQTHVFAWQDGSVGEHTADFFYPVSITEKEKILSECEKIKVDTVVSVGSDLAVHTVNYIARSLGLPCNDETTDRVATDKFLMRGAFQKAVLPTPCFTETGAHFDSSTIEGFQFPLIVKPTDRSGSRGIYKISAIEELNEAVRKACEQSFSGKAIVEEFVDGPEYSCECINWRGNHRILAFTKKFTTGAPHFIETGHLEPADIPAKLRTKLESRVYQSLDALNIRWGAAHVEFRINGDDMYLMEIGARMGGDCIGSDLVLLSTGFDFLKMVIDVSMGREPDFTQVRAPEQAEVRFIFSDEDEKEIDRMCKEHPECVWRRSRHERVSGAVTDSSNRWGYCIFRNMR